MATTTKPGVSSAHTGSPWLARNCDSQKTTAACKHASASAERSRATSRLAPG